MQNASSRKTGWRFSIRRFAVLAFAIFTATLLPTLFVSEGMRCSQLCFSQDVTSLTLRTNSIYLGMFAPSRPIFSRLSVQQPTAWNLPSYPGIPVESGKNDSENEDTDKISLFSRGDATVRGQIGCFPGENAFWINAVHTENDTSGDVNSAGYQITSTGVMTGRDWLLGPSSRLGFGAAYLAPRLRQHGSEASADSYNWGLYYQENFYGTEINCWAGYGHQEITTRRRGGEGDDLRWYDGETQGDTFTASVELGKVTCYHGCIFVRPSIGVDMIHGWQYGFTETTKTSEGRHKGYGYGRMHLEQTFLRVGTSVKYETYNRFRGLFRIEYAYLMQGDPAADSRVVSFETPEVSNRTVYGASIERDFLNLGVGAQCALGHAYNRYIYGDFDVSMSSGRTVQAFTLGYIEKF